MDMHGKNKIYFCPFNNSLVKSYDVVNGVAEDIPVSVSSGMYTNIIVKDDYIYLMPQKLDNGILKYNLMINHKKLYILMPNTIILHSMSVILCLMM